MHGLETIKAQNIIAAWKESDPAAKPRPATLTRKANGGGVVLNPPLDSLHLAGRVLAKALGQTTDPAVELEIIRALEAISHAVSAARSAANGTRWSTTEERNADRRPAPHGDPLLAAIEANKERAADEPDALFQAVATAYDEGYAAGFSDGLVERHRDN
jgi:hypothetical protein